MTHLNRQHAKDAKDCNRFDRIYRIDMIILFTAKGAEGGAW